jgi:hypothetical protein
MKQKLKYYVDGKIYYTPIMNIMMNNRSKNWYAELGKYINETLDIEKIPYLSYFSEKLKKEKSLITKIKDFVSPNEQIYTSIAISFLTGGLDEKSLENMFGKPLLHDKFGEGFDGEWNEEKDDYDEPEIKEFYASYFVNVGGTDFHIGYDHRGTGIEIQIPNKFNYTDGVFTDEDAKNCFDALKKLVDLYKEKCNN